MQIVIDIDEKIYRHIVSMQFCIPGLRSGKSLLEQTLKAIRTGTPLPKGHGRLIDADALNISHGVFLPRVNGNTLGCPADAVFVSDIDDAPTIIEADKESEDRK